MQQEGAHAPEYPPYLVRAVAFLIDWAIVLLVSAFVATGLQPDDRGRLVLFLAVLSVYEIGFVAAIGTTPGKAAMKSRVTDGSGGRLAPDRAILRYLVLLISILTVVGFVVSAGMILFDPQRRALHDRVAGTVVRYVRV